jgi:ATP-binding cassette subfamily C protein
MRELFRDLNKLRPLFSRKDKKVFIFLLVLMFVGSILEAIGIGIIPAFVSLIMKPSSLSNNQWIGHWFPEMPDEPTFTIMLWASGLFFLFVVLKNLFLTLVYYVQSRIVTEQQLKLGDRMFRVYQSAPYEWHLQRSSSELVRNIQNDTSQVLRGVLLPFLELILSIMMALIITLVMVWSMPGVALMGLMVTGVGLFLVIRLFQKKLQSTGEIVWKAQQEIIQAIQQGFGALVDARILGCEEYLNKVHKDVLQRQTKAQLEQLTMQKATPYAIETFAVLGLLVILFILVTTTKDLSAVLPIVVLLGVATIRLKQLASRIAASINQINIARANIPAIVNDLKELDDLNREKESIADQDDKPLGQFEKMEIVNVDYAYPNSVQPALNNISLSLRKGESIAFIGETGCGKSTLVNIILGLLVPGKGRVMINGHDIHHHIDSWQAHLGYIPQTIYLIDDSIRSNVAFGVPKEDIDETRLVEALKSACLEEFVGTLPDGLDTTVGERGVRLSGGQRQRLGIARALYPDPDVLIMDEATSALDNRTETEVMLAIQKLKSSRTLIMIAHRLSTVEDCDRLFLINEGKIVASGSYMDILSEQGDLAYG